MGMTKRVKTENRARIEMAGRVKNTSKATAVQAAVAAAQRAIATAKPRSAKSKAPASVDVGVQLDLFTENQRLQAENAQLRADLARERALALLQAIVREVDDAIMCGRMLPALRNWALALGEADPKALKKFIAESPVIPMLVRGGSA